MVLITLMVFNALIMAISLSQPNSPHSINETPGLHSINEAPGLLHSISTQRHTTFGDPGSYLWSQFSQLNTYSDSKRLYVSSSGPRALT